MKRLNIRCCCQPQKILGSMEVPNDIAKTAGEFVAKERVSVVSSFKHEKYLLKSPKVHRIQIRAFTNGDKVESAVYSEDRPIEFWKNVESFEEAKLKNH